MENFKYRAIEMSPDPGNKNYPISLTDDPKKRPPPPPPRIGSARRAGRGRC